MPSSTDGAAHDAHAGGSSADNERPVEQARCGSEHVTCLKFLARCPRASLMVSHGQAVFARSAPEAYPVSLRDIVGSLPLPSIL